MTRGRLSLVRPHAEEKSRSEESQLKAAHEALATARESILGMELQLEAERRAREEAEERIRIEQHACSEAMRLLEQTVEPLRELKAAVAEHDRRAEEQARIHAELAADRDSAEAEVLELDATLGRTLEHAEQFRERLDAEACARQEASLEASAERLRREEALRAMVHAQHVATEQQALTEEQARAYAELEAKASALETQLAAMQASREAALDSVQESGIQFEVERHAREEAESRVETERAARDEIRRALLAIRHAADEQSRAHAEFKGRRRALEVELKEMEGALAHAEYQSDQHAQRRAELTAELEKERRAREEAEAKFRAACQSHEEPAPKPRRAWKKLFPARR